MPKPFKVVLEELGFLGPFLLRATKLKDREGKAGRESIQLVADGSVKDEMCEHFGSDRRLPIIFPVAAFAPKPGTKYECLARWRNGAHIIEAVPSERMRTVLARTPVWNPGTQPAPRLEFIEKGGRFAARLESGALVIPYGVEITAAKTIFAAGEMSIKPATTRPFWVAGKAEAVARVSDAKIDTLAVFNGEEVDMFNPSWAAQFRIFGRFLTAFEIFGYPNVTRLIVEKDHGKSKVGIVEQAEKLVADGTKWWRKIFALTLHPDVAGEGTSEPERERRSILFGEAANERDRAAAWLFRWARWTEGEVIAGRRDLKIPKPIGRGERKPLKKYCSLVEMGKEQLVDYFLVGQPEAKRPEPPKRTVVVPTPRSQLDKAGTLEEAQAAVQNRRRVTSERLRARLAAATAEKTAKTRPAPKVASKPVRKAAPPKPVTEDKVVHNEKATTTVADQVDPAIRAKLEARRKPETPLEQVAGIGPKTAEKLMAVGVKSAEALAKAPKADLELQLGAKEAKKLIAAAKELIG